MMAVLMSVSRAMTVVSFFPFFPAGPRIFFFPLPLQTAPKKGVRQGRVVACYNFCLGRKLMEGLVEAGNLAFFQML